MFLVVYLKGVTLANTNLGPHGTIGCLSAYLTSLETCIFQSFDKDNQYKAETDENIESSKISSKIQVESFKEALNHYQQAAENYIVLDIEQNAKVILKTNFNTDDILNKQHVTPNSLLNKS